MHAWCRQDEGSVGQGYTVREMCQLARSSMPAQRTAACRHLSALLARSRPSAARSYQSLFGGGKRPNPLCVPGSEQVLSFVLLPRPPRHVANQNLYIPLCVNSKSHLALHVRLRIGTFVYCVLLATSSRCKPRCQALNRYFFMFCFPGHHLMWPSKTSTIPSA